jgi:hypothetical protein
MIQNASENQVQYTVRDGIAAVTLNRPPVNALSLDLIRSVVRCRTRRWHDDGGFMRCCSGRARLPRSAIRKSISDCYPRSISPIFRVSLGAIAPSNFCSAGESSVRRKQPNSVW